MPHHLHDRLDRQSDLSQDKAADALVPEVVENGVTGYLAPVGDIDALAARSIEILADPAAWQKMSAAARAAAGRFGADRVVTMYEDYYSEVLSR